MGLLSFLLGCNAAVETGPDFSQTVNKVIHFENSPSIAYEMPGNMSNLFNFAEKYANESPKTFNITNLNAVDYKQDKWRLAKSIDGAMWDYLGKKSEGPDGELGRLNVDFSINKSEPIELEAFIERAYEHFLNGPDGMNTEIRESEDAQGLSDDELGHWIVHAPTKFERKTINGTEYLHWSVTNEHRWREFVYYVFPLNDETFVAIQFHYSISANGEEPHQKQNTIILSDIDNFMQRVNVSTNKESAH